MINLKIISELVREYNHKSYKVVCEHIPQT